MSELEKISTIANSNNSLKKGVNKQIYAFKDEAVGFTEVFNQTNDAIAVRLFTQLVNDEKSAFHKYADQMSLWNIGEYNDVTGNIISTGARMIIQAKQCLTPKE